MTRLNKQYTKISREYIFPVVERRLAEFRTAHPRTEIINMGIGDIAMPLAQSAARGASEGAEEMTRKVYGYGPSEGMDFLRERLVEIEYEKYGITPEEIFISDGINSAICGLSELFPLDISVGILDPTYPLYHDINFLAGRENIHFIPCTEENNFLPSPPAGHIDIVYLTTPNNPTGVAFTKDLLQKWVDWAHTNNSLLLIDAAYEGFIKSPDVPKSIYEIPGAKGVAIEFRSFSKTFGFTGLRAGYTILPKEILVDTEKGQKSLWNYWSMDQNTKTNGVSYVVQRAALAALSNDGLKETGGQVAIYQKSTEQIKNALLEQGQVCYGGIDSPYIWWKVPYKDDWEFFDFLLHKLHIIAVPGIGFGPHGKGFVRLSGFQTESTSQKAIKQLRQLQGSLA